MCGATCWALAPWRALLPRDGLPERRQVLLSNCIRSNTVVSRCCSHYGCHRGLQIAISEASHDGRTERATRCLCKQERRQRCHVIYFIRNAPVAWVVATRSAVDFGMAAQQRPHHAQGSAACAWAHLLYRCLLHSSSCIEWAANKRDVTRRPGLADGDAPGWAHPHTANGGWPSAGDGALHCVQTAPSSRCPRD